MGALSLLPTVAMPTWYQANRTALIGVVACLLFGGLEVAAYLANGVQRADLNTPMGALLSAVVEQFTPAPSAVRAGSDRRALAYQLVVGWQVLLTLSFTALLWLGARLRPGPRANALLALQMCLGVLGVSSLLFVQSAQLAVMLPLRRGLQWIAVQSLMLAATFTYMALFRTVQMGDTQLGALAIHLLMGMGFTGIVFAAARVALAERAMRLQLGAANASLLATQAMLADTVRSGERMRIARDLHDAVGHHLTALNLHLDLALRQAGAGASESLQTSRELSRSLLSEVRSVVGSERSEQRIELGAAIATLCAGIPAPAIRLRIDVKLDIASPALAHTLFFCVQEALTNAVRHSGASEVTIDLWADGGAVLLNVGDNGNGARDGAEGNGMRGMRERVAEQAGTLQAGTRPGGGFEIAISVPMLRSAA